MVRAVYLVAIVDDDVGLPFGNALGELPEFQPPAPELFLPARLLDGLAVFEAEPGGHDARLGTAMGITDDDDVFYALEGFHWVFLLRAGAAAGGESGYCR